MNRNENQQPGKLGEHDSRPPCFGDPQKVCPRDEGGIMQPQISCLACGVLKSCLQTALRRQGLIAPSVMETPAVSKVTGFIKRWSDQKLAGRNVSSDKASE